MNATATRRAIAAADLTAGMLVRIPGAGADLRVNGTHTTDDPDIIGVWLDGEALSYPFGRDVQVEVVGFTEWPARDTIINRWSDRRGDRTMGAAARTAMVRGLVRAQEGRALAVASAFPGAEVRTFVSDVHSDGVQTVTTYVVAGPTTPRH